jgi:hypothetical protein
VWDQALDGMVGFWGVDVWDEVSGMGEGEERGRFGGVTAKGDKGHWRPIARRVRRDNKSQQ